MRNRSEVKWRGGNKGGAICSALHSALDRGGRKREGRVREEHKLTCRIVGPLYFEQNCHLSYILSHRIKEIVILIVAMCFNKRTMIL